jgi:hypothetical protein
VINKPTFCMFWTQVAIVSSSCSINTLEDPLSWFWFYHWGDLKMRLVKCSNTCNLSLEMCVTFPLYDASMASSNCQFVHLSHLDALGCLLVMVELCTIIVTRWHCCYVVVVVDYKCWFTYVIKVVGWGCWLSSSSQLVLETPLHWFLSTLRCVWGQSSNSAPLVCGYKTFSHIGRFILALLIMGPISKHSGMSTQVLQEVQVGVSYMKTN